MTTAAELPRLTSLSHGAGCACKLPLATLERLMASVGQGLLLALVPLAPPGVPVLAAAAVAPVLGLARPTPVEEAP